MTRALRQILPALLGIAGHHAPPAAPVSPSPTPAPTPAPSPSPAPGPAGPAQVFPHVRVDLAARLVEFDATVEARPLDPETPLVFLEVIACTPGTREHEALVLSRARAEHVHAALLLLGLTPGAPGSVAQRAGGVARTPPSGPALAVTFEWSAPDGSRSRVHPSAWIKDKASARRPRMDPGDFVFAGSRTVTAADPATGAPSTYYAAQAAGTLIGLSTFGDETIAWTTVLSPESALDTPVWIADPLATPPHGTPVVVSLAPIDPAATRPPASSTAPATPQPTPSPAQPPPNAPDPPRS